MDRRRFLSLVGLTTGGLIFAPRFGRWFRPNRVWLPPPPVAPVTYVGSSLAPAWPAHQAGDIAVLTLATRNEPIALAPPAGWTLASDQADGLGRTAVFWRRAGSNHEPPAVIDGGSRDEVRAFLSVFRNANGLEFAAPRFEASPAIAFGSDTVAVLTAGG